MKKSLVMCGVAALALASCTKNEVLTVSDSRTIGFTGSGVENVTRVGDITSTEFSQFFVYGGYDGASAPVFNGVEVNRSGDAWSYNPPQYWVENKTYHFGAYAPKADDAIAPKWDYNTGLTLEVNSDATHQNDLVYAGTENVSTGDDVSKLLPVSLQFTHLLSKIQFKFLKDAATLGGQTVTMMNFKVDGITTKAKWEKGVQGSATEPATGAYEDFKEAAEEIVANTGLSTDEYYVIPQNVTADAFFITAKVVVTDAGGTEIKNGTIEAKVPATTITKWDAQNRYRYTATLTMENIIDPTNPDPKPIEFTGSVSDWAEWTNGDNVIPETK